MSVVLLSQEEVLGHVRDEVILSEVRHYDRQYSGDSGEKTSNGTDGLQ